MKSKPWLIAGIVIGMVILVVGQIVYYPYTVRTSPSPRSSVASTAYTKELSIEASENLRNEILKNLPPTDAIFIQSIKQDLYNDGNTEDLLLHIQEDEHGIPVSLHLTVDGVEKVGFKLDEEYNDVFRLDFKKLEPGDVTDVLLYQGTSGSSGAEILSVYRPSKKDTWEKIFAAPEAQDSDFNRYIVKYIGNYQVSFLDKTTGLRSVIDLDRATHQNVDLDIISNWVDPVSDFEFSNANKNEADEIIAIQRVIGIAHPDTIAELRTTYKLKNGQYEPITESLTTVPGDREGGPAQVLSEIHF
jgi:hypothetical protein